MTSQLTDPFTCALLREAADAIEEGALELKQSHSWRGTWLINERADLDAFNQYTRHMHLVQRLRLTAGRRPQAQPKEAAHG